MIQSLIPSKASMESIFAMELILYAFVIVAFALLSRYHHILPPLSLTDKCTG